MVGEGFGASRSWPRRRSSCWPCLRSPRAADGSDVVVADGVTQPVFGYADATRQRVWVEADFDTEPRRRQGPDRDGHHPAEGVGHGPQGAGDHGRQPVLQHARARQRVRAQGRHRRRRPLRSLAAVLRQLLRAAWLRGRAARHGRDEQLDRLPADGRPVRAPQRRRRHRLAERPPARLRQGRQPRRRQLAQRQDRHDRQVLRRHARERRRLDGRRRPVDDRADLGDLELVRLRALERDPVQHELPVVALEHGHRPGRPRPVARPSG